MMKDRGSIKWVSLMLPEHVKMLRKWHEEINNDWTKPILNEDQLEEMNRQLENAIANHLSLTFTVASLTHPIQLTGKVHTYDHANRKLKIQVHDEQIHSIRIDDVIHISSDR